jgi:hypothetical protein
VSSTGCVDCRASFTRSPLCIWASAAITRTRTLIVAIATWRSTSFSQNPIFLPSVGTVMTRLYRWRVFLNRPTFEDGVAACRDYSSQRKARFLQERPKLTFGALTPAGQDHHQQIHQRLCRIIGTRLTLCPRESACRPAPNNSTDQGRRTYCTCSPHSTGVSTVEVSSETDEKERERDAAQHTARGMKPA